MARLGFQRVFWNLQKYNFIVMKKNTAAAKVLETQTVSNFWAVPFARFSKPYYENYENYEISDPRGHCKTLNYTTSYSTSDLGLILYLSIKSL